MLSPRRILLVLPLILLPAQVHAQKPTPVTTLDKADVSGTAKSGSSLSAGSSLSVSQRDTLNFKYTDLGYSHFPYPAFTGTFANGQQAQFIVDTGSDGLSISDDLANRLGLSPDASRIVDKSLVVDGKPIREVKMPDCVIQLSALSYPLANTKSEKNLTINGAANVIPTKHIGFIGADGIFGTALLSGGCGHLRWAEKRGHVYRWGQTHGERAGATGLSRVSRLRGCVTAAGREFLSDHDPSHPGKQGRLAPGNVIVRYRQQRDDDPTRISHGYRLGTNSFFDDIWGIRLRTNGKRIR